MHLRMLSLLVPTMPSRSSLLSRLLWTIEPQLSADVECIVHTAERPMGDKLNELYAAASGEFAAVIDDDDMIPPHYVRMFDANLLPDVDFLGFNVLYTVNGRFEAIFPHDPARGSNSPDSAIRALSCKNVIRTDVARAFQFGNGYTDDFVWCNQVLASGYPRNPRFVDEVLYHYDCWPGHSLGTTPGSTAAQRDVGTWPFEAQNFLWL